MGEKQNKIKRISAHVLTQLEILKNENILIRKVLLTE